MTEEAPPDVKRRRLSAADGDPHGIRSLIDLPGGILAHAASYLAAPSRVLFAISLDENSAVTPNEMSSDIVGNQWDVLDFGQIEKDLAEKLSDPDIEKVLLIIDAVNKLKRLKLANCTKITGVGLEPLRGSAIIEQIDLSLVGVDQSPDLDPAPPISCEHMLPILDSIIEREGCALMHLQFPSVWRKQRSTDSEFHAFMGRYNQMRGDRDEMSCLECNVSFFNGEDEWGGDEWIVTDDDHNYGTHLHTCYGCLKHYCHGCAIDGEVKFMMRDCITCKRDYCKDCVEMTECSLLRCENYICNDCYKYECVICERCICSGCVEEKCEHCDKCYCEACYDEEDMGITCSQCDIKCCDDCRLQRYQQGHQECRECIKRIAPLLVGEILERKQLQEENEQLKLENEAQKRKIEELEAKLDNEELRSRQGN